ncbi:hypothetical protein SMY33_003607 [Cronobacter malonaticus]|uniref:hypothetical protein n=1 Tax=Cronobacter malonaticus TaxID=413503 RepID=UPI00157B411A|nr:hypothetical protein [Cronobacter malonaticus]EKY3234039.1 hypothetical protein [Cronobacter malonaticus]ELY4027093.1 hypothetical protein [Cronobacter malonaticus]MDI7685035.1 hypothetical protein [Cronobacter malonaticus]
MGKVIRWMLFFVGLFSVAYSIYKYRQSPQSLFYIIGAIGTLLSATCGLIELKSKKSSGGISAGDNSNIVVINGSKNTSKIKKRG